MGGVGDVTQWQNEWALFELRAAAEADGGKNAGDCRRDHRQSNCRTFPCQRRPGQILPGIVIDECNFPGKTFPWRQ